MHRAVEYAIRAVIELAGRGVQPLSSQVFAGLGRRSALTLCDRLCHTLPAIRLQPCDKLLPGPGLRVKAQQFANEI